MKGGMQPVMLGQYFRYFQSYWNPCRRRNIRSNTFFLLTKVIFLYLQGDWKKNHWNNDQLIWIYPNIETGNSLLDPINFVLQD